MRASFWIVLLLSAVCAAQKSSASPFSQQAKEYLQCQLCSSATLSGQVKDCNCDVETVDTLNDEHFAPLLDGIRRSTFFRYFRVNLWKDCRYWSDHGMCNSPSCAVCHSDDGEVPRPFVEEDMACSQSPVDGGALGLVQRQLPAAVPAWKVSNDSWIVQDESEDGLSYVDLLENPERFTGYSGYKALRIWDAIYRENCFQGALDDMCLEERVLYRLISGLHTSINTHVATDFYFEDEDRWGVNVDLYVRKIGTREDYLENLYFLYVVLLRALGKASDAVASFPYHTGDSDSDARLRDSVNALISSPTVRAWPAVFAGFNEEALFQDNSADEDMRSFLQPGKQQMNKQELKVQFKKHLRNISLIMDCVECEKCRLWGKLQVLGLGTAMKILSSESTELKLSRNELIAFVNLLHRVSESVAARRRMRELELQTKLAPLAPLMEAQPTTLLFVTAVLLLFLSAIRRCVLKPT